MSSVTHTARKSRSAITRLSLQKPNVVHSVPPREIIQPSTDLVHAIPYNSHRRQIDARTSRASLSSKPINLRQFRERDRRELHEVIANLHAGRNLERDTPRFGKGNGKVMTYMAQSGTC